MIVDAHCHLDEISNYALDKDILPVTCGHSHSSNLKTIKIAKKLKIPFVLGISPQAAQKESEDISKLGEWIETVKRAKPNAIGEIGLDYHWAKTEEQKKKQLLVFNSMLDLAEELRLPIVIHCRDAGDELLAILEKRNLSKGAMWHFFSGSEEQAKHAIKLGIYLSFPPLPSKGREKAIALAPIKQILAETDAPSAGQLPRDAVKSIEYIASIKHLTFEEVAMQTAKNAARLFNFSI